jgi:phospholipase C
MTLRTSLLGASLFASSLILALGTAAQAQTAPTPVGATAPASAALETALVDGLSTATPIKHLVVIYDENVSFDHYFATYPHAANPAGEPPFTRASKTPAVNNLSSANLLTNNPNDTNTGNGANAANPFRLDITQAATADQDHNYTPEQQAEDGGKMDLFPEYTGNGTTGGSGAFGTKGQVMGYYDGNTVTALWQYASHFAMNDNAYTDTFGPSTPGALEVVDGQTNGLQLIKSSNAGYYINDGIGGLTLINDVDPGYDSCSSSTDQAMINAKNIGDLLNAKDIPWGGFMGGFNLQATNANGTTGCLRSTTSTITNTDKVDYVAHHNWFQYFTSTANPTHARPTTMTDIGYTFAANSAVDPANHQYDITDFTSAVAAGDYPAVSYIKLPAYQDGHAGYSDPLDEQNGLVTLINFIESQPDWSNTAIIVTYDDSDGWYDHAYASPTNPSFNATADQLSGPGVCGSGTPQHGVSYQNKPVAGPVNGRCGPGTRIPFIVISPYARQNYVDNFQITQASVVKFIEANWLSNARLGGGSFDSQAGIINRMFDFTHGGSTPALVLDPTTGEPSGT